MIVKKAELTIDIFYVAHSTLNISWQPSTPWFELPAPVGDNPEKSM
jgi:hypothetical protein